VTKWYQSRGYNSRHAIGPNSYILFFTDYVVLHIRCTCMNRKKAYCRMSEAPPSAEGGSQLQSPKNINPGPVRNEDQEGGDIWIKLNKSRDEKHSEVLETVKILKAELQSVKTDNERILKAQEELNQMLLNKLKDQPGKEDKGPISSIAGTGKHKRKNSEQISSGSEAESIENDRSSEEQRILPLVKPAAVDRGSLERNISIMRKLLASSKRSNPLCLTGK